MHTRQRALRSVPRAMCLCASLYASGLSDGYCQDRTTPRFTLAGRGSLQAQAPVQQQGAFELHATLSPVAVSGVSQPVLESGHFELVARASVPAQICYNDTIFRDAFQ